MSHSGTLNAMMAVLTSTLSSTVFPKEEIDGGDVEPNGSFSSCLSRWIVAFDSMEPALQLEWRFPYIFIKNSLARVLYISFRTSNIRMEWSRVFRFEESRPTKCIRECSVVFFTQLNGWNWSPKTVRNHIMLTAYWPFHCLLNMYTYGQMDSSEEHLIISNCFA